MRYRILLSVEVDEADDARAFQTALKLEKLLKEPFVQMTIEGNGIRLAGGDGALTVHQPVPVGPYR